MCASALDGFYGGTGPACPEATGSPILPPTLGALPSAATLLAASMLVGCAAGQVAVAPDAIQVQTGTQRPVGATAQLGAITATHGGGCGIYGTRGNLEGAYTILRNRAAQLGADYVQVLRVSPPHIEGMCKNQAYVIDGLAYRLDPSSVQTTPTAFQRPSLTPPIPPPTTLADAIALVSPSVVRVETDTGSGSGVIVDPNGRILTAAHVIDQAKTITVVLSDDRSVVAEIRGRDDEADVALLSVSLGALRAATIGSSQNLRVGEEVAAKGSPLGLDRTVTRGIVSALRLLPDGTKLIQTDAAINTGNSGGPVVNMRGEVVGISSFKIVKNQAQGLGFAVAVDTALARLRTSTRGSLQVQQPQVAAASVTGTYSGSISGTQAGRVFSMAVTFTIAQQGDRVSATWITSGGTSGNAAGILHGTQILEFLATQIAPCPGSLRGSVDVEDQGGTLRGSYAGQGCGMPVSASFIVNRQP